jgi:glucosamine-6-phosphate deaminase
MPPRAPGSVRPVHPVPAPLVLADEERVAHLAAELIANRLRARPALRLLLSGGRAPMGLYAALRAHARFGELPSSAATVLALDEYVGLASDDPRSRAAALAYELRGIQLHAFHRLDGSAADLTAESARHERLLDEAPIDLAVLGLGNDGHVAFDEPGSRLVEPTRVVRLSDETRAELGVAPEHALTVGLGTMMKARELLVLATGSTRATALRSMLLDAPSSASPASLLRAHPRMTVVCDRSAAAELPAHRGGHHVCVVLGHREPSISAEHRISHESLGRVHRAEWIARNRPTLAAILTGYTSTGGLSEAEQMRAAWRVADVPPVLEVAGRDTAENATRSLPLVLALGDVRRVTVVTSAWHLRAPYHFRACVATASTSASRSTGAATGAGCWRTSCGACAPSAPSGVARSPRWCCLASSDPQSLLTAAR